VSKTRVRLLGRAIAGVGSGLAYGALAGLLYGGALPLALAGAAVVAMRLASSSLSTTMFGINQLYENILYLDLYTNLLAQTTERTREPGGLAAPTDPSEITLTTPRSLSRPGRGRLSGRHADRAPGRRWSRWSGRTAPQEHPGQADDRPVPADRRAGAVGRRQPGRSG